MAGCPMMVIDRELASQRPPSRSVIAGIRRRMFGSPAKAVLSTLAITVVAFPIAGLIKWALVDSVVAANHPDVCKAAAGACWATVVHHARVVFFGLYPQGESWRPVLALAGLLGLVAVLTAGPVRRPLLVVLLLALAWAGFLILMRGGVLGLSPIRAEQFGGLPLSVHAFLGTVALGFPAAFLLALGRECHLPAIRWFCASVIEVVRAVPLLTLLFCTAVVVPIMLPELLTPDKINRVIAAMALFYACYQAEVIRGGIRAVPAIEIEGARALGLKEWQVTALVVLPQALRVTIPATTNLLVVALKDTALASVVGLFDFVASANTAIASDAWAPFFKEIYIVVALTFLALAGGVAALGRLAEHKFALVRP
jgi:general L-amino acid transport system permease protein